jgi:hypothetical protein
MTICLDRLFVPSRNMRASATLLAQLLGVPCEKGREGPFFAIYVNDGLTLDFIETDGPLPSHHFCFRVTQEEFDAILGRIQAAGIKYGSEPGSTDTKINTRSGGSNIYWKEPDGHQWEMLTISYARPIAQSGSGCLAPSPHTTSHAGPHETVHKSALRGYASQSCVTRP